METDRSRIIAMQTCPRSRWLAYHANGTGLQRRAKSLPLQFGSAFHVGAELLLNSEHPFKVELAVKAGCAFLTEQFEAAAISFDGELPDDAQKALEYGREEHMALAEALLRAWYAYEGESFLSSFDVLEVEQEGRANLTDDLTLMFRPDALVRDRASGDLYIVSWKTCSTFSKRSVDQARHDMQSISEMWGIVAQFNQDTNEQPHKTDFMVSVSAHRKIEGILYKWIVKGRRTKDDWDGLYKQDSHLIYGWQRVGSPTDVDYDWAWRYSWTDDEINAKTGKPVQHKLGKGWRKVPIWRDYPGGVKQWIDDLAHQRVFPRHIDALAAVFPQALPVERRADEVESWKRQVIAQEFRVVKSLDLMPAQMSAQEQKTYLDLEFPQYTHACHSFSGCPFIPVCWEGAAAEVGDLYQIRLQNHPESGGDDE
jgi:PD-(D/E)XK nuclease superfamily